MINHTGSDAERVKFIERLAASDLLLTEWEQRFVADARANFHRVAWFTRGRREATDKIRMKYGAEPEIGMPLARPEGIRAAIPEAEAEGCQYFVRGEDGRQLPCNSPATCRRRNGFRYCDEHADQAQQAYARTGKFLRLEKL